ncbi:uncharacterized protein BT62DRAFT_990163 [Guyanagaster necrorhizus]|uniref:Uncharacterized protein n=1 Tax=Guyanagaster necrorhizus TaxID=856835 RepID=A0A9P7W6W9_9AGAR|nr:uncharacterized protein BT62DRAFT_990163 [Guyanagaster necrorhizus MCA 3950]KAG7453282.1 hypothetical protein BT62DRAFT_990163 [Guyanagaster necrorhizus MCA 3950]
MNSSDTRRKSQMALDQFKSFFLQDRKPSVPDLSSLGNHDGTSTYGSELLLASYGTEEVNVNDPDQLVYDLNTHEVASEEEGIVIPCTETCFDFELTGTLRITTIHTTFNPPIDGHRVSATITYRYPTPMWDGHIFYIPFESAFQTSIGVNIDQILRGNRSCLKSPGRYLKALDGLPFIDVVFHSNGYLPQYIRIALRCAHIPALRNIDVAFNVALGYRKIMMREESKISPSRTDEDFPVVIDEKRLNLVGLYSRDSSRRVWWADVAICD